MSDLKKSLGQLETVIEQIKERDSKIKLLDQMEKTMDQIKEDLKKELLIQLKQVITEIKEKDLKKEDTTDLEKIQLELYLKIGSIRTDVKEVVVGDLVEFPKLGKLESRAKIHFLHDKYKKPKPSISKSKFKLRDDLELAEVREKVKILISDHCTRCKRLEHKCDRCPYQQTFDEYLRDFQIGSYGM
jgi:Rad3-related DNA helicase